MSRVNTLSSIHTHLVKTIFSSSHAFDVVDVVDADERHARSRSHSLARSSSSFSSRVARRRSTSPARERRSALRRVSIHRAISQKDSDKRRENTGNERGSARVLGARGLDASPPET